MVAHVQSAVRRGFCTAYNLKQREHLRVFRPFDLCKLPDPNGCQPAVTIVTVQDEVDDRPNGSVLLA